MSDGGYIVLLCVALVTAAFAAGTETAINSAPRLRMRGRAEDGDRRARLVVRLQENPNESLSTVLTLNTVAVIVASASATRFSLDRLPDVNQVIVDVVLSVVALVIAEIAPKSLALRYNETAALRVARVVVLLTTIMRPVVGVLTFLGTIPLRLLGAAGEVRGPFVTEQELKLLVNVSEQQGVVEQEERQMIHGVLELTDKLVREVMVPRVDVTGVEVAGTIEDVITLINETGHSRVPVYETTIDNIVGIVYAKDLLRPRGPATTLREIAREAYFVPESKRAGELLHELQVKKVHMAVVVDEYGGTAGVVTLEDLTEEIVGEIRDEYDAAEQEEVQFLSDREALVTARLGIDDAKELLHLDIDTEEVESDSLGGLIYERLGEIPRAGASIQLGDATLTVESVRRNSIRTVRILSRRPFQSSAQRDERGDEDRGTFDSAREEAVRQGGDGSDAEAAAEARAAAERDARSAPR